MDCSTFSTKSTLDATNSSDSDITEKYYGLQKQYELISKNFEKNQQETYEAKRNYETALDIQKYLTTEIEVMQTAESKLKTDFAGKLQLLQEEIQSLRDERHKNVETHANQIDTLEKKIRSLEEKLSFKEESQVIVQNETASDECSQLKNENSALLDVLAEHKSLLKENAVVILGLKERLESAGEELLCAKSNLGDKREELTSLTDLLHSTQGELAEVNTELQRLKSQSSNHATKGNSLFAEVEDKRQEMAKNLIHMKQTNGQLKRELVNKQAEIDALLCEKKSLWEEYAGLSSHHDATLISAYEERIAVLERMAETQRREILKWFSEYYKADSQQESDWVAGVLAHLRNRCDKLSEDLTTTSVDCLAKATEIRELHRQVASWRLKAFEIRAPSQEGEKTNPGGDGLSKLEQSMRVDSSTSSKAAVRSEKPGNAVKKSVKF